ncbi:RNA polymerase, sigma-24 subunit, ECF subfamily [Kribbella flavida DSM 17836]|uniref:RNA polymerase, sigma-24 subunit, ECF subfamily n=1 Tax=Kribbella flavida (strain DSM 17836 / JCM 10339 / NBRC 14399) TaxID=479435 RepID=D2PTS2_KRIFD|nr:RNA polymerase sigma factor [Kribbella flavida]ADB33205.1 RNA polymerase, sigma-24 subunit, ECF subfamily [Kribbella flavida DSM 17836]
MRITSSLPPPVRIGTVPDHERRFRELFEDQFRGLLGYALRRVGSPDDAADVVAETMLVAWRRIDDVPADETARLWLYGVARRVVANHRRGHLRRESLAVRLRQHLAETTPDAADLIGSTTVIRQGLAAMSDDDRELLMLTAWDGLELREAAVVLGVPARTIRTRLHRARARLRTSAGDAFDDAGHVREDHTPRTVQEER